MADVGRSRTDWRPYSTVPPGVYCCSRIPLPFNTSVHTGLPAAPIRARQQRSRQIHILSFPPGIAPVDVPSVSDTQENREQRRNQNQNRNQNRKKKKQNKTKKRKPASARRASTTSRDSLSQAAFEKLIAPLAFLSLAPNTRHPPNNTTPTPTTNTPAVPSLIVATAEPSRPERSPSLASNIFRRFSFCGSSFDDVHDDPNMIVTSAHYHGPPRPPVHRNSISSVRTAKNAVSSFVAEVPKPVAAGSGVSCSILLAEPNIFLSGFEHDGHRVQTPVGTGLLRGKLQLTVTKNVKIKGVSLKLVGKARTEWPEGIPPLKVDVFEEETLRTQVLTFFNAINDGWEAEYGNSCTYRLKSGSGNNSSTNLAGNGRRSPPGSAQPTPRNSLTAREMKRLSLQSNQSRSFGKGDGPLVNSAQAKGYKVFYPGTYEYSFELPIDHHQLETTKLQYGNVKWELHAQVERAGAFKPNLHGQKEVSIVRVPDQLSLEMTEPISISRRWEDQLHYDIIISGKSFPIGTKIPIAFKLTPLAKVQVHKLKVFCTETVEYWTNDRRVTRKDPGKKILLLEKAAGKPLDPQYAASDVRVLSGGELSPHQRREAREAAAMRRSVIASRHNTMPDPLPEPAENLLGDLDLGLESYWGSTEIEMNVQIPTCEQMNKCKDLKLHPDCSWKNANVYHWIKIVMRISRIDPDDPTGTRRRHFEISIDSPFTVLNCRATQANTALPQYSGFGNDGSQSRHTSCGCPDAATISGPFEASPNSSTGTLPSLETSGGETMPAPPQAAHLHAGANPLSPTNTGDSTSQNQLRIDNQARPMHLIRVPSYNPPAFDAEAPPPPAAIDVGAAAAAPDDDGSVAQTPPPQYDVIVGTPSVDGLADYFTRLADYGYDHDDSDSADEGPERIMERSGRVNVAHPRTPGGRRAPSRSLEIQRPPVELQLDSLPDRPARTMTASELTG